MENTFEGRVNDVESVLDGLVKCYFCEEYIERREGITVPMCESCLDDTDYYDDEFDSQIHDYDIEERNYNR